MSHSAFNVLPEESSLRGSGPFFEPLAWPPGERERMPRALRALARIVNEGLCHRCGSCVGICPTKVLAVDGEDYPRIKNLSACTDCDLCVRVCPGDEFDVASHSTAKFGTPGDLRATHGQFDEGVLAYAKDPRIREGSTSGGLVTGLLLHLLERGHIDGAVVIASDEEQIWKGKPIVARTARELLGAMKSKYAISPTNAVLSEVREVAGRYAVVGLPCQIHGVLKAMELDRRVKERVVLTVGLFCHAAIEHEAFGVIWNSLPDDIRKRARRYISRVGKHPGTPHVELDDGTLYPVYFGDRSRGYRPSSIEMINIVYRLFTPARCMTCFDASAEFADISVGDPWMAPPKDEIDFHHGWSFALVRNAQAKAWCLEAQAAGHLDLEWVTERESHACNRMMFTEKRWRAFRIIETHKRQGKPVPVYGEIGAPLPDQSGKQFVKTEIHMFTHIFCFLPKLRAGVLRFMLSRGGYWLLWINHKRRAARVWIRDTRERWRRRIKGRE